ncbi:MAG TPA: MFS transporter [Thermomicrobiales bacterium]|nr:MFS transporter [Thermomicrobiales bacterium]
MALSAYTDRLATYRAALTRRDFRYLFLGQAVSQFGDWINKVALIVLVYQLTGRQAAVALVMLAQLLPRAVILPFGGVLADRYPKRDLMLMADLVRAFLATTMILVTTARGLWWMLAAVLAMQGLAAVFNPARSATIPALVPREHLGAANAINSLSGQLAFFLGPALGGLFIALWGVDAVFLLNAATFLLSAFFLWRMRLVEPAPKGVARGVVLRDLREGWAVVARERAARAIFSAIFLGAAVAIGLNVLLVALLADPLRRPAADLGPLMTMVGLGTLGGTALALGLMGRLRIVPLVSLLALGLTLDMVAIGAARSFAVVAAALVVNGALTMANELIAETTLQRLVPADRLGRVLGLLFWTMTLGQVVGAVGAGLLPDAAGLSAARATQVLGLAFAALLGVALVGWVGLSGAPARRRASRAQIEPPPVGKTIG